ncbi:MAG: DNA polymerase III subunit epsilon [Hyphomonadaceae bacterium]|nr:DNA polymerase III subunit epsilon [Hyphomonadaceae bacterium]MBX3511533.1 DNA polymerase III subunit epsilon [Hyphomonadaceae bacterium]
MREILFDTETTGIVPDHEDPRQCDRIVEIGCVEVINLERTGREFHAYVNPGRSVPQEVVRVHGLDEAFLRDKPRFADVVGGFLEFVADAPLVAHNASFDQNFINAELRRCGLDQLAGDRFVDTLVIARKKFPGASCSLDALARRYELDRYGFDLAARKGAGGHGALVDARILAEVYLQLQGGREQRLAFDVEVAAAAGETGAVTFMRRAPRPSPLPPRITAEEEAAHAAFIAKLGENALWKRTGS